MVVDPWVVNRRVVGRLLARGAGLEVDVQTDLPADYEALVAALAERRYAVIVLERNAHALLGPQPVRRIRALAGDARVIQVVDPSRGRPVPDDRPDAMLPYPFPTNAVTEVVGRCLAAREGER